MFFSTPRRHHDTKIKYDAWIDAFEACVDIWERERDILVVYRCRTCSYWHVGYGGNHSHHARQLERARRKRVATRARREREEGTP